MRRSQQRLAIVGTQVADTVGYEALMYGKSIFSLGNTLPKYGAYNMDVSSLNDLAMILSEATKSNGLIEKEVIEFAHGIIKSNFEEEWANSAESNVSFFVNPVCRYVNTEFDVAEQY